jgi:acyl-CoA thioesterase YciA
VLKVIPMPGDANANGDIFGGWVMAQVDLAGSVLPARSPRAAWPRWRSTSSSSSSRCGDILSLVAKMSAWAAPR